MSHTVSDFIVSRLHQYGVRRIFGYPGGGISGVFGELNRADVHSGVPVIPDQEDTPAELDPYV